ncbi:MAG: ribosome-binding factor A [Candidatus Paceibacterota bacterium]|jgi:ribosome-binding factor A
MSEQRHNRMQERIRETASQFITLESNRTSIITITGVDLTFDEKMATILFTVMPTEKESEVLDFLKRQRTNFREFFKEKTRVQRIPFFDFVIDIGEKNRQKIDSLLQKAKK